jgi:ribosomal protein L11 methylase PrmA
MSSSTLPATPPPGASGSGVRPVGGSFRDPAAYVYEQAGVVKRAITRRGLADLQRLSESGLLEELHADGSLIPHVADPDRGAWPADADAVIVPERVPYVSYPYEWSFHQLKDAALLTLHVQERAMARGMSLKDASAFNVQFRGCAPIFIDTLSFEPDHGGPWVAYQQYCRHFVGPLLLMRHWWEQAGTLMRVALDGLPLDVVSRTLPRSTYLSFACLVHVHLHARSQARHQGGAARVAVAPAVAAGDRPAGRSTKGALIASLRSMVEGLTPGTRTTEWANYYAEADHYSGAAEQGKRAAVAAAIDALQPSLVFDLGANTGVFSRLAVERGAYCVSFDIDPSCVDRNYTTGRDASERRLLPLLMDLSNPSADLGFASSERLSLAERATADTVLALALVHHLRITVNAPFARIAAYLARLGRTLVIEWVPKDDPKVAVLLRARPDTFHDYTEEGFQHALAPHFETVTVTRLPESGRAIYVLRSRAA